MGNFGIKGALEDKAVTSSNSYDFAIWSKDYNLKIMNQDVGWPTTCTILGGAYYGEYTITHNLGYLPLFDLYFEDRNGKLIHIPGESTGSPATRGRIVSETVDAITVRLGHPTDIDGSNRVFNLYHFIYLDPRT